MLNKQSGIQHYGKNAKKLAEQNINAALLFLYQWGWSTEKVIRALLGLVRRPCASLVRRGILKKIDPEPGFKSAYVIGAAFIPLAHALYESRTQQSIPYHQHRTLVPFRSLGHHNETAQLVALHCLTEGTDAGLTTDLEFRLLNVRGAIPDFRITEYLSDGTDLHYWHEIELTAKYQERLYFQLQEREKARLACKFQKIFWWCGTYGILLKLRDALHAECLPMVERRADGKIVRLSNEVGWSPRALARASEFRLIEDVL